MKKGELDAKNYRPPATVTAMAPNKWKFSKSPKADEASVSSDEQQQLTALVGRIISGKVDRREVMRLLPLLRRYVKVTRRGVKFNGKGLVDLLLYMAPRLPVRDVEALKKAYGVTGSTLAAKIIKSATHQSAAVGGVTGAMATATHFAPPLWVTLPVELTAETLLVTAVEMRMIAELHAVYELPFEGSPDERAHAILEAWSTRRGVDIKRLEKHGRSELERDHGLAKHLTSIVKRKLMARAVRNLGTFAPLFVGAAIGAETNRRSTRDIGNAIVRDLQHRSPSKLQK